MNRTFFTGLLISYIAITLIINVIAVTPALTSGEGQYALPSFIDMHGYIYGSTDNQSYHSYSWSNFSKENTTRSTSNSIKNPCPKLVVTVTSLWLN
jgi:hypothetical protein